MKKRRLAPRLSKEGWQPLQLTGWFSVHCGMQIWDRELLLPFVDRHFAFRILRSKKTSLSARKSHGHPPIYFIPIVRIIRIVRIRIHGYSSHG